MKKALKHLNEGQLKDSVSGFFFSVSLCFLCGCPLTITSEESGLYDCG